MKGKARDHYLELINELKCSASVNAVRYLSGEFASLMVTKTEKQRGHKSSDWKETWAYFRCPNKRTPPLVPPCCEGIRLHACIKRRQVECPFMANIMNMVILTACSHPASRKPWQIDTPLTASALTQLSLQHHNQPAPIESIL